MICVSLTYTVILLSHQFYDSLFGQPNIKSYGKGPDEFGCGSYRDSSDTSAGFEQDLHA